VWGVVSGGVRGANGDQFLAVGNLFPQMVWVGILTPQFLQKSTVGGVLGVEFFQGHKNKNNGAQNNNKEKQKNPHKTPRARNPFFWKQGYTNTKPPQVLGDKNWLVGDSLGCVRVPPR